MWINKDCLFASKFVTKGWGIEGFYSFREINDSKNEADQEVTVWNKKYWYGHCTVRLGPCSPSVDIKKPPKNTCLKNPPQNVFLKLLVHISHK